MAYRPAGLRGPQEKGKGQTAPKRLLGATCNRCERFRKCRTPQNWLVGHSTAGSRPYQARSPRRSLAPASRRERRRGCPPSGTTGDREWRWPAPRERRGPSEPTPGKQWRERDVGRGRRRRAGKGLRSGGGCRARGVRHPGVLRPRARGRIRAGVGALRKGRPGRAAGAAGSRTPPRILHSPLARSLPAPIPPPSLRGAAALTGPAAPQQS